MPSWRAEGLSEAGLGYPPSAYPASSVLIMRARAFKASLEPVTPPLAYSALVMAVAVRGGQVPGVILR